MKYCHVSILYIIFFTLSRAYFLILKKFLDFLWFAGFLQKNCSQISKIPKRLAYLVYGIIGTDHAHFTLNHLESGCLPELFDNQFPFYIAPARF